MALSLGSLHCVASATRPGNSVPSTTGLHPPTTRQLAGRIPGSVQSAVTWTGGLNRGKSRWSPLTTCRAAVAAPETFTLTLEQKETYERDGYLVLEGFASADECAALQERMQELVEAFDPASISVFSSKNQTKTSNDHFLNSGGNISFFFEENAFDEQGSLRQPKGLSINKVGHALHDIDPVFRGFSRTPKMAHMLKELGFKTPVPVQSMYIFKQPGIGGEVIPHQDSSYLFTDPPSCVGLWLAVEDATQENGCLWALPGSHKDGLFRRFVRTAEGGVAFDRSEVPEYDISKFVPVEVPKGALVLLHGANVHFSYENRSPKSRHAYSVHVIEREECKYLPDNWLQRTSNDPPFEPLFVE